MKCRSCKEDVPPKFAHALSVNVCPLCGQEIMVAQLQKILNDLKNIMNETKEYSEEVSDWLFSNYGLKKWEPQTELPISSTYVKYPPVDTIVPPHNKPNAIRRAESDIEVVDVPNENTGTPIGNVSLFAKRAGVKPAMSYKDVISKIQGAGAADPSEFKGEDDEYGAFNGGDEVIPQTLFDPHSQNELISIFENQDSKVLELEKLKRLRQQSASNGSKIRRSE
jgi:hypothetical protein